jgi:hypothetical protein
MKAKTLGATKEAEINKIWVRLQKRKKVTPSCFISVRNRNVPARYLD